MSQDRFSISSGLEEFDHIIERRELLGVAPSIPIASGQPFQRLLAVLSHCRSRFPPVCDTIPDVSGQETILTTGPKKQEYYTCQKTAKF